jgi:glycosyltransferase involved in cell wall biosynthesis
MKKLLILAPYPIHCAPSQRFRFEQYLPELEKELDIESHSFIDMELWNALYKDGRFAYKAIKMLQAFVRRKMLFLKIAKCDYLFIHREVAQVGPPIFEWIIAKILRKKFIYDFDDAIWIPNYSESNAKFQRLKAYWKVRYIMKWAHTITAGNQYLANFALQYNSNVIILPTTIDMDYHKSSEKEPNEIVIGWTGSHTTVHYLNFLTPVLKKLAEKHLFKFRVISNQAPEFELENLDFVKWNKESEIEDLSKIDIGVMPLVEDQWSSGKCGFKALQYMSLGIPTVLSPVGVNEEIVEHNKTGFLVTDADAWISILSNLIEDKALRETIGQAGKNRIQESYSVEANTPKYSKLFDL